MSPEGLVVLAVRAAVGELDASRLAGVPPVDRLRRSTIHEHAAIVRGEPKQRQRQQLACLAQDLRQPPLLAHQHRRAPGPARRNVGHGQRLHENAPGRPPGPSGRYAPPGPPPHATAPGRPSPRTSAPSRCGAPLPRAPSPATQSKSASTRSSRAPTGATTSSVRWPAPCSKVLCFRLPRFSASWASPLRRRWTVGSKEPRLYGGNLDKDLTAGSTLFLPAWVPAGLGARRQCLGRRWPWRPG